MAGHLDLMLEQHGKILMSFDASFLLQVPLVLQNLRDWLCFSRLYASALQSYDVPGGDFTCIIQQDDSSGLLAQ